MVLQGHGVPCPYEQGHNCGADAGYLTVIALWLVPLQDSHERQQRRHDGPEEEVPGAE